MGYQIREYYAEFDPRDIVDINYFLKVVNKDCFIKNGVHLIDYDYVFFKLRDDSELHGFKGKYLLKVD